MTSGATKASSTARSEAVNRSGTLPSVLWVVTLIALWALALGLAWWARSPLYAIGFVGLVSLALWRPSLGAYLFIGLASVDLLGTVDLGRFTLRSAQLVAAASFAGIFFQAWRERLLQHWLRKIPRPWFLFAAFSLLAMLRVLLLPPPNPVKAYAYAGWSVFAAWNIGLGLIWILSRPQQLAIALRVLVLSGAASAVIGLSQWSLSLLGFDPPLVTQWLHGLARINALSFEPSYFAFAASLSLSLAIGSLLARRPFLSPPWAAASATVLIITIALSSSRSGWIALLAIAIALLPGAWFARSRLGQRWRSLIFLPLAYAIALLLLTQVRPGQYARMARMGMDIDEVSSSAPRIEGVMQALKLSRNHLCWGVGIGQFGGALAKHQGQTLSAKQMDARVTYNLYAELLVENGIIGLSLVLGALVWLAWLLWRLWRRGNEGDPVLASWAGILLLSALLHFGLMAQFNQTFFRSDIWHLLGLIGALLFQSQLGADKQVVVVKKD